jgi:hypothetical protein
MPLSGDPVKRAAQLANLRRRPSVTGDGGLQRATKHGVYAVIAERELSGKVRELYEAIGEDLPVRDAGDGVPAQDAIPLRMLAETLIRRERIRESELRHGVETPDGKLRGIVEFGLRLDNQALRLCIELGLTPRSRAALGLDLIRTQSANDQIAGLAAEGRLIRERREREDDGQVVSDEG